MSSDPRALHWHYDQLCVKPFCAVLPLLRKEERESRPPRCDCGADPIAVIGPEGGSHRFLWVCPHCQDERGAVEAGLQ